MLLDMTAVLKERPFIEEVIRLQGPLTFERYLQLKPFLAKYHQLICDFVKKRNEEGATLELLQSFLHVLGRFETCTLVEPLKKNEPMVFLFDEGGQDHLFTISVDKLIQDFEKKYAFQSFLNEEERAFLRKKHPLDQPASKVAVTLRKYRSVSHSGLTLPVESVLSIIKKALRPWHRTNRAFIKACFLGALLTPIFFVFGLRMVLIPMVPFIQFLALFIGIVSILWISRILVRELMRGSPQAQHAPERMMPQVLCQQKLSLSFRSSFSLLSMHAHPTLELSANSCEHDSKEREDLRKKSMLQRYE